MLVVIGILIALQINNWNENRKTRNLERETLVEIYSNLKEIESDLIESVDLIDLLNTYTDTVIDLIETQARKPEVLKRSLHLSILHAHGNIQVKKVGYETLKNRGVDIVKNKELKNSILSLYEDTFMLMERYFTWSIDDNTKEYLLRNFSSSSGGDRVLYTAYNYDSVLSDPYFNSILRTTNLQRLFFRGVIKQALEDTKKTIELVKKELKI